MTGKDFLCCDLRQGFRSVSFVHWKCFVVYVRHLGQRTVDTIETNKQIDEHTYSAFENNEEYWHIEPPASSSTKSTPASRLYGLNCNVRGRCSLSHYLVYSESPPRLRAKVTALPHDNPESGHFVALNTAELISRNFYWPALPTSVRQYIAGCEVCHRIKAARHPRYSVNMPIELPSQPWEGVTMDFVTDLPESTASAYTGILVVVDRLTKMAIYLPCRKDVDSPELARMFFEEVICKHGVPSNIVTDQGSQFMSRFWNRVC
jgi:hypothetical protein